MAGRIEGKIALVTGAGSSGPGMGTGKAISIALAREGAAVLLVDNVEDRARETLDMIKAFGGSAEIFVADIRNANECEAMVETAADRFGGLDIVVNNAAIVRHMPITDMTPELYSDIVAVNLTGAVMACKYAIPKLVARGGGSIVNIASIAAVRDTGSSCVAYSAAKAGMLGLTVDLAGAYGRQNVRVNTILPGIIITPMAIAAAGAVTSEAAASRPLPTAPNLLGRFGDAWDIANATLFLASDEAAYISGVVLPVDGGAVQGTAPTQSRVDAAS